MPTNENCECSNCRKSQVDTEMIEVLMAISVVAKQLAKKLMVTTQNCKSMNKGEPENEPNE